MFLRPALGRASSPQGTGVRAKSHLFSKRVLQVVPWARYRVQVLARYLLIGKAQRGIRIYLWSHSKVALRPGVDGEENQGRKVSCGQKSQRMIFRTQEAQH